MNKTYFSGFIILFITLLSSFGVSKAELAPKDINQIVIITGSVQSQVCAGDTILIPYIFKGGKTIPENLQILCEKCNLGKGNRHSE